MKYGWMLVIVSALAVGCLAGLSQRTVAEDAPKPLTATAELVDGKGQKVGTATFTQGEKGVSIKVDLSGLPAGVHAFHIHEAGKCEAPDFKSSGGHFNPFGKKHGAKNPDGPHAGDLGNITVGDDGKCAAEVQAPLVILGAGKNSLLEGNGTCLMIHEKVDDETTDPTGNAGARIACGLIKKSEAAK
ncbi:MAG: superoxide dismutase family protein [Planctomycetes bacterium]|nr:superoxide dismutase family protein [Planctomycetota bacterium]